MSHIVAKPFNTSSSRFKPGQEVTPADIDGPVEFTTWVERGFITATPPASARQTKATKVELPTA